MTKRTRAKRTPKTHFEQIPLDVVEKAIGIRLTTKGHRGNVMLESVSTKTEPYSMRLHPRSKAGRY